MSVRRNLPACPAAPQAKSIWQTRGFQFELITPMFGGVAQAKEIDPTFAIRATSIRGQLQFWWRATVGAQYPTKEELRRAQSAIWGDTTRASRVRVRVDQVEPQTLQLMRCAHFEKHPTNPGQYRTMPVWDPPFGGTSLPYALFPFQGRLTKDRKAIEVEPADCIPSASFIVRLSYDPSVNFEKEVEPAVWAWANFGGLGSRTRRGCGSILCKELAIKDRAELDLKLLPFLKNRTTRREWPTLAAAVLVGSQQDKPITAWSRAIALLRDFRQGVNLGRNPGHQPNRPGRSRWPEPETLRRITGQRASKYARLSHIPDDAFPRAEFGLPIVFHFQSRDDPRDTQLYPSNSPAGERRERMASPLILKPLALQNGQGRKYLPLVLHLVCEPPSGVDLRDGGTSFAIPFPPVIRDPKLATYSKSPMAKRSSSGSAVEAFLRYAREQNFQEVK